MPRHLGHCSIFYESPLCAGSSEKWANAVHINAVKLCVKSLFHHSVGYKTLKIFINLRLISCLCGRKDSEKWSFPIHILHFHWVWQHTTVFINFLPRNDKNDRLLSYVLFLFFLTLHGLQRRSVPTYLP